MFSQIWGSVYSASSNCHNCFIKKHMEKTGRVVNNKQNPHGNGLGLINETQNLAKKQISVAYWHWQALLLHSFTSIPLSPCIFHTSLHPFPTWLDEESYLLMQPFPPSTSAPQEDTTLQWNQKPFPEHLQATEQAQQCHHLYNSGTEKCSQVFKTGVSYLLEFSIVKMSVLFWQWKEYSNWGSLVTW